MEYSEADKDNVLIEAFLAGDESALERLFERYRRPIYNYLIGVFSGDSVAADDVFQETWLRIINALPGFGDMGNFPGWAFRIAHNQAMQSFRRRKSRDKIGALTADGELPETAESRPDASPDAAVREREIAELLAAALAKLPAEQREVFMMRRENMSFREIAAIQNCPLNTALSRMRYVTMFLRKELDGLL